MKANDLELIQQNLIELKKDINFWDLVCKKEIKRALLLLKSIDQESITYNSKTEEMYHKNEIEIFTYRALYFENDIEFAWNINQITDFIKKEQIKPRKIETAKLVTAISKKDIQERVMELNYLELNDEIAPYKKNNPVIFIGIVDDNNAIGLLLNGNHRVVGNKLKGISITEAYVLDPQYLQNFLASEEYQKLNEVVTIYNVLKHKTTGISFLEWQLKYQK